ncbi:MAG: MBL fold metallo-hydrolase [Anaerolineales bacterium]|nr:MBL fold metallo-hydrolase [Anaerolineales bacterium]
MMEITWYGLASVRIRESGVIVVCDPYEKALGAALSKVRADIVTVSHEDARHNAFDRITGDPKVLRSPGEYEVKNIFISALATFRRRHKGEAPERNIAYFFEYDDLTVGHLGDIGEVPSQSEIEDLNIGEVDVLLVPVGGGQTLDPARAVEIVGMLEPRIVIPMYYRHSGLSDELAEQLEPVDKFLKELGVAVPEPIEVLKLTKSNVPEETQVVLLTPSM